ncbi:MAG: hypothetical protein H0X08_00805 [Blastocatellia bacterium]|nr:hypothetical protein [Blastocatellia bacterium]
MSKSRIFAFTLALLVQIALLQSLTLAFTSDITDPDADIPKFESWGVIGPDGGDVRTVAIDPRNKDRIFNSTLDGQIHISEDAGQSWRLLVNLDAPELILDNLLVDSRDSKRIYASGHRHKEPGGFFRSSDGGVTWKESKELRKESIHALTQAASDPGILMAGTVSGIWISKNSGEDWEKIQSPTMPNNIDSMAVDPRTTSTIYAGTWWRAYKSTDSGKSWRLIKDGMIDDSDVFAITVDPRNPEHLISSACSGIYESFNAGEKWSKIQGIPSQSRRTRDILQHPSMPKVYYAATTEGFWMSSNGGKSWAMTTMRNLEVNSIAVHQDAPNRVFIGTNNYGVMVSNDGGKSFTQTNARFSSRFTYSVVPDREQPNRLYAATQNVTTGGGFFFTSADGGATWTPGRNLDIMHIKPFSLLQDRVNANTMYLGTSNGIYRSLDRGISWTALTAPKKPPVRKAASKRPTAPAKKTTTAVAAASATPGFIPALTGTVKELSFSEDGRNGLYAGTDRGLYRTYDITKGWEKINLGVGNSDNVSAIHESPASPGTIWVGTASTGALVSRDNGVTWQRVGGAADGIPVVAINSDPKKPEVVYVGTAQTLYVSRDGGASWRQRGGNLPLGHYSSILINPDNTDEVIVASSLGNDGGIFVSYDSGNKWRRVDTKDWKLPSRRVWSLAFDPSDSNRLFAGTHSAGVYKLERKPGTASTPTGDRPRVAANPQ